MLQVHSIRFFQHELKTRFPFRYGIASMTEVPYLFVRAEVSFQGKQGIGTSADLLPPKWFTKDPESDYVHHDLPEMRHVIAHASKCAVETPQQPTFFHWWQDLYESQKEWAKDNALAPLLANFGLSLVERAILDAIARASAKKLHTLLSTNVLGIDLGSLRPELTGHSPSDVVVSKLPKSIQLRHTVGMADPLTNSEIQSEDEVNDSLPHSLAENIQQYGLQFFKLKLSGNRENDHARLNDIASVIEEYTDGNYKFTMDGNENYRDANHFRDDYEFHLSDRKLNSFLKRGLIFVEQPLHRDWSLDEGVRPAIESWPDAPPMIIDESDADLDSLPKALQLGYSGTSHKNCKGIVKGLLNAASVKLTAREKRPAILSGEDLANLGPVALLQDLAMAACLGIPHVERNGHHYFAGLSMFPKTIQEQTLKHHPDLYHHTDNHLICVNPQSGTLNIQSVVNAPFGMQETPNLAQVKEWKPE